jgi:hypothetical protein
MQRFLGDHVFANGRKLEQRLRLGCD